MKHIFLCFLFMGCVDSKVPQSFLMAHKNGCITIIKVEINDIDYGNFVLCTVKEYKKRIK